MKEKVELLICNHPFGLVSIPEGQELYKIGVVSPLPKMPSEEIEQVKPSYLVFVDTGLTRKCECGNNIRQLELDISQTEINSSHSRNKTVTEKES
jgi:hypothetical protein